MKKFKTVFAFLSAIMPTIFFFGIVQIFIHNNEIKDFTLITRKIKKDKPDNTALVKSLNNLFYKKGEN